MKLKNFAKSNWKYFIKYSIVGFTGTIIDVGGFTLLIRYTSFGETLLTRGFAAAISFIVAVTNNFTWNKLWTFKDKDTRIARQFVKFLVVSIGGLILNIGFLTAFSMIIAAILEVRPDNLPVIASVAAKLGASAVVLSYNFLMNRYWTFNPGDNKPDPNLGITSLPTGRQANDPN